MTNTTSLPIDSLQIDPRPTFFTATDLGRSVIAAIRPDQFGNPTPCSGYNVRDMVGHVVSVLQRLAVVGAGGDPMDAPDVRRDVADNDWLAAFDVEEAAMRRVWSDDAVLGNVLRLPWATMPGSVALPIYVSEISVHTWDLAMGTEQRPSFDDEVLTMSLAAMHVALPANERSDVNEYIPFGPVVETPADAPAIDRLVAWTGRPPRFSLS